MTQTPTDALRLVPVPFNLLSEAAGLLDCEGYGPISSQLNALLAGSGLPSRGDLHTALMDAIHGDLMRQNPGAFVEEDGNSTLAIPTSKAFLTVDVSSLAESALEAFPASLSGGADVHHLLIEFANAITGATLEKRIEHLKAFSARFQAAPASPLPEGGGQLSKNLGQLKSPDLDALEKLADEATSRTVGGEWTHDEYGVRQIWAKSIKGGDTHIADVRGWGYFTGGGHGALGLTEDEGIEAQRQVGKFIAAANPATIKALIAELKEARGLLQGFVDEVFDAITSDGEAQDCKAQELTDLVEMARQAHRAFLARNGKGEG